MRPLRREAIRRDEYERGIRRKKERKKERKKKCKEKEKVERRREKKIMIIKVRPPLRDQHTPHWRIYLALARVHADYDALRKQRSHSIAHVLTIRSQVGAPAAALLNVQPNLSVLDAIQVQIVDEIVHRLGDRLGEALVASRGGVESGTGGWR